jgi:hypothetical protein
MTSSGESEKEAGACSMSAYGEELLSANWNPIIEVLAWSCGKAVERISTGPTPMSERDADGFLGRIYTFGA